MTTTQAILRYLKKHPTASYEQIARASGFNARSTAEYHVKKLIKAGKLSRSAPVPAVWKIA